MATDACARGWGSWVEFGPGMVRYNQGTWEESHIPTDHSTYVELRAVYDALRATSVRDRLVRILTDNTCTVARINAMWSPVDSAKAVLLQMLNMCLDRNLALKAYYVPGRVNTVADYLSRFNLGQ